MSERTLSLIAKSYKANPTLVFDNASMTEDQLHIIPDMTIASSGLLTKWSFAARFKYDEDLNEGLQSFPELQIWRKSSESGNTYVKIAGTSMKPRPTGYLNVFEYDISNDPVEVKAGDVLGVYQPSFEDTSYSLAFVAVSDTIDYVPTNYIVREEDLPSQQVFHLRDGRVEQSQLLPLVFAEIRGNE